MPCRLRAEDHAKGPNRLEISSRGVAISSARFSAHCWAVIRGALAACGSGSRDWASRAGRPIRTSFTTSAWLGQSYHEHPLWLGDPTRAGGHGLYQGLPLLPGIWIARLLGLGPALISLVWRCWGGGLAGLAWYWVVRVHRVRPWVAVAVAIFLLTDIGMLEFRPLLRLGWVAWQVFSGHTGALFASKPMIFRQFRIRDSVPDDALSSAFHRPAGPGLHGRRPAAVRSHRAIGFGLLFYVYFYYWTAAALALAIAAVLDAGHRRTALNTALIGAFAGVPSLVASYHTRASTSVDWLLRSDKFMVIGRFSELNLPMPALLLLVVTAIVVWRFRREPILPWSLAASPLVLANHQIITGLQIETSSLVVRLVAHACHFFDSDLMSGGLLYLTSAAPAGARGIGRRHPGCAWSRACGCAGPKRSGRGKSTRSWELTVITEISGCVSPAARLPSAGAAVMAAEELTADWARRSSSGRAAWRITGLCSVRR